VGGNTFSSKFSSASGTTSGGGTNTSNGPSGLGGTTSSSGKSSGGRKSSKAPHTLKERIIHLLAVKPQRRCDIINRLKKETKRGETAMSKTDSLLQEVADVQGDMYHLKQSLFSELRVDDWPFYSDAERQLVKRRHGGGSGGGGDNFSDYMKV
jgi:RNA polymerase II elongation factor ELL